VKGGGKRFSNSHKAGNIWDLTGTNHNMPSTQTLCENLSRILFFALIAIILAPPHQVGGQWCKCRKEGERNKGAEIIFPNCVYSVVFQQMEEST